MQIDPNRLVETTPGTYIRRADIAGVSLRQSGDFWMIVYAMTDGGTAGVELNYSKISAQRHFDRVIADLNLQTAT